jgi:DNA polymerase-4
MAPRAVIHVDLDAFFASVEIKKEPGLKGRPVIVGADGDPKKRGVVSAASYEARKSGVRSGMTLKKAYAFCPLAVFSWTEAQKESERFMELLTPQPGRVSLDGAFIEILSDAADSFPTPLRSRAR